MPSSNNPAPPPPSSPLLRRWLGTFDTAEEAAVVYDIRKRQIKGGSAKCNFPPLDMGGPLGELTTPSRCFNLHVGECHEQSRPSATSGPSIWAARWAREKSMACQRLIDLTKVLAKTS